MPDSKAALPVFNFMVHPSAALFNVPYETYASSHPHTKFSYTLIATGSIVFDSSDRVLLIQRAASDSMPNRWETPGGGCDKEDPSILHSAVRELWEEAGLVATSVGPRVGDDHLFLTRSGRLVCKFYFMVETERGGEGNLKVKLDPVEHQNYVWASGEDVEAGKVGDVDINFTTGEQKAVVVEAFRARKEGLKV